MTSRDELIATYAGDWSALRAGESVRQTDCCDAWRLIRIQADEGGDGYLTLCPPDAGCQRARVHTCPADGARVPAGRTCPRCNVLFDAECYDCGRTGYHAAGCPRIDDAPTAGR